MQVVRKMHLKMRQKLCGMSWEQINEEKQISQMYCPMYNMILKDLQSNTPTISSLSKYSLQYIFKSKFDSIKAINQADMAFTQFAFIGFILLYPEEFGIHNASKEDLEALCHTWRGFGYLLGAEDEFNICNGTLEDVKQRLSDFIEYVMKPLFLEITPEWEHMSQCYVLGLYSVIPYFSFDMVLLYLAKLININMPSIYNSMTYSNWILYNVYTFFIHHCTKVPFISRQFNKVINYAIDKVANYDSNEHTKIKKSMNYAYSKIVTVKNESIATASF